MHQPSTSIKGTLALLVLAVCHFASAQNAPIAAAQLTPPRLSYTEGRVSFWRAGAEDWTPARVNTPLAAGDALYTAERSIIEVQVGARAFVRAPQNTHLELANLEPDFMQFTMRSGQASFDLRGLPSGHTVEIGTPNALFTIEQSGYYRIEIEDDATHFTTRRGGRALVSAGDQSPRGIAPSEEIIVRGIAVPVLETYTAPPLDDWDRWNYARTDHEIEALGARYVSSGVYGVGVLDDWGAWRVVPVYGPVWVPRVAASWAPYSTGSWIWDPYYGWTWVDDAPWGWAPFHYGRWVFISGYWAWAPGPVIARAVYAPALVAFFNLGHDLSVRIGISVPAVSWVALGWGEPLLPWWGHAGFRGAPWWGGWGGPRLSHAHHEHLKTPRAHVATAHRLFGSGPIRATQFSPADARELERIRDAHPVRPERASLAPLRGDASRPPAAVATRPVYATRTPRAAPPPELPARDSKPPPAGPAPRIIAPPKSPDANVALPRPTFGEKGAERQRPAPAPRFEAPRSAPPPRAAPPEPHRPAPPATRPPAPPSARPAPPTPPSALPGRPAHEVAPRRMEPPKGSPPQPRQPPQLSQPSQPHQGRPSDKR